LTGLAMTLWLLLLSISIGFVLSVPLAVARVSRNRLIRTPVWLFTYVFRGTPLYIQLLIIYSGIYSLSRYARSHCWTPSFAKASTARCWPLRSIPVPTPPRCSPA